jgi:hypothetical protein
MDAMRLYGERDVDAVVDDEGNVVLVAERFGSGGDL